MGLDLKHNLHWCGFYGSLVQTIIFKWGLQIYENLKMMMCKIVIFLLSYLQIDSHHEKTAFVASIRDPCQFWALDGP